MGHIILLTGISGSGKTTLGKALKKVFKEKNKRPVEFIDGDIAREFLGTDLGYTPEDRMLVTKQIAFAAHLLSKNGIDVIVANIAGGYVTRDYLRGKWEKYLQVFLNADVKDCMKNDPKGVYKEALKQEKPYFCGLDIPYDQPRSPDVTVYPYKETVEESLSKITSLLEDKGLF